MATDRARLAFELWSLFYRREITTNKNYLKLWARETERQTNTIWYLMADALMEIYDMERKNGP